MICNLGDPMSLRHPVRTFHILNMTTVCAFSTEKINRVAVRACLFHKKKHAKIWDNMCCSENMLLLVSFPRKFVSFPQKIWIELPSVPSTQKWENMSLFVPFSTENINRVAFAKAFATDNIKLSPFWECVPVDARCSLSKIFLKNSQKSECYSILHRKFEQSWFWRMCTCRCEIEIALLTSKIILQTWRKFSNHSIHHSSITTVCYCGESSGELYVLCWVIFSVVNHILCGESSLFCTESYFLSWFE